MEWLTKSCIAGLTRFSTISGTRSAFSGIPEARDEYYDYLPEVMALVRAEAEVGRIAAYLINVETARMGLSGNTERARDAAEVIAGWKEVLRATRR
jgi:hypothetical protein